MPVKVSPEEWAEKWGRRLTAATEDIKRGVDRVTVSPGQKAAANADKWAANVAAARGRYQANVGAMTLQSWQDSMKNKGVGRISSGVAGAQTKAVNAARTWLPIISAASDSVQSMPSLTIDDSVNRASAFIRRMHEAKTNGGR